MREGLRSGATYVVGVDGGGSKVACLVAEDTGRLCGYGRAGPVNTNYVERPLAVEALRRAVRTALEAGGLLGATIERVCISAPTAPETVDEALADLTIRRVIHAAEGETPRWAAHYWVGMHVGVTVDAGTGSIARGWTPDGHQAGAGGWGATLGDEGSGYWIGLQAMRAICEAQDGRTEETGLAQLVFEHFGFRDVWDMVFQVSYGMVRPTEDNALPRVGPDSGAERTRSGLVVRKPRDVHSPMLRHEVASVCPLVVRAAQEGDRAARRILAAAGHELGRLAVAVIKRLYMTPETFAVVPFGGVFKAGELVLGSFRETIAAAAPGAQVVLPRFEPVVGAVLLALDDLGITIDWPILEAIEQSAGRFPGCRA
jgi:N-acetylglucosamine kinase-like BadF-type ATPase